MVAGIQSGLQALTKSLCQVEAVVESQGRQVVDSEGRPEVAQSQSRASLHVPDGLVHHALPVTDDGSISLRGLRPFRAEVGEFELVVVL